ncbi:MAG: sodium/glutamate symporter, partial [Pseudomonadota bacterium]
MILEVPAFIAATIGFAIFVVGTTLNRKLAVLRQFNIPEPVSGGLLAAVLALALYLIAGIEFDFDMQARDFFLVLFFAGIGLNARLMDLVRGGMPLLLLLGLTIAAIILQNIVGVAGAAVFGYPVQAGVLFGSAALIGGHGTAIA